MTLEHCWIASLGLFAGGMLTEACVLVPFWRSLSHEEFIRWYQQNSRLLTGFFTPLTLVPGGLALLMLTRAWVAPLLMLACVASFFIYFKRANASFLDGTASPEELARWNTWHTVRTILSLVALGAALHKPS